MKPKTRAEAAAAGEKYYFTGRPCKNGHNAPRYTKNGICKECATANIAAYRRRRRIGDDRGFVSITVMVPESAVDVIKQTAALLAGGDGAA